VQYKYKLLFLKTISSHQQQQLPPLSPHHHNNLSDSPSPSPRSPQAMITSSPSRSREGSLPFHQRFALFRFRFRFFGCLLTKRCSHAQRHPTRAGQFEGQFGFEKRIRDRRRKRRRRRTRRRQPHHRYSPPPSSGHTTQSSSANRLPPMVPPSIRRLHSAADCSGADEKGAAVVRRHSAFRVPGEARLRASAACRCRYAPTPLACSVHPRSSPDSPCPRSLYSFRCAILGGRRQDATHQRVR